MLVLNSFSLNMLALDKVSTVTVTPVTVEVARDLVRSLGVVSAVGHADTAAVFSHQLDTPIPMCRSTVRLTPGSTVLVGQLTGPRLPEGATSLPEGAAITWVTVTLAG